jgi:chromosome segregation ATPase
MNTLNEKLASERDRRRLVEKNCRKLSEELGRLRGENRRLTAELDAAKANG